MKKIKLYEVRILESGKNTFETKEYEVLAENDTWIVLNTNHFEKVTKTKTFEFCNCRIDKARIDIRTRDKLLGNGVFYKFFTYKTKKPSTIRNEINKRVSEEYGFLSNIDLSFIK